MPLWLVGVLLGVLPQNSVVVVVVVGEVVGGVEVVVEAAVDID